MKKDILVKMGDLFNVERRLKEIDAGYEIFFNQTEKRYEVHNKNQKNDTLSLVVPFSTIDNRLVGLVRKTRVERAQDIFREIEEENEKLLNKQEEKESEKRSEKAREKLMKLKSSL